ncbi:unnamed protein product, partial [Polarella glacialis]
LEQFHGLCVDGTFGDSLLSRLSLPSPAGRQKPRWLPTCSSDGWYVHRPRRDGHGGRAAADWHGTCYRGKHEGCCVCQQKYPFQPRSCVLPRVFHLSRPRRPRDALREK